MGLLDGVGRNSQVIYLVVLAVVGEPGRAPQAQDDVDYLVEALSSRCVIDFEVGVFINYLAAADAKV